MQQASKVLYSFAPDKSFGQLIKMVRTVRVKTIDAEFIFAEVWLTDQNNRPLEFGDNVNINILNILILKY